MPIDVAAALAAQPATSTVRWSSADVLLYHLALGAGVPPTDSDELRYAYERDLHVLPSFAVVTGGGPSGGRGLRLPGIDVNLAAVLHAGQEIEVHAPIPVEARAESSARVAAVYDKGSAAVIVLESTTSTDRPLFTTRSQIFVRGEGGFGGERGPSAARFDPPDRAADTVAEVVTLPQQALLYRLCGDRNPLHADPDFAKLAGFDRPILHGLCTYGMVCKAVVDRLLGADVTRVRSYTAQFTGVLFPGETVRVRMWQDGGPGTATVRLAATAVERDDAPVLAGSLSVT